MRQHRKLIAKLAPGDVLQISNLGPERVILCTQGKDGVCYVTLEEGEKVGRMNKWARATMSRSDATTTWKGRVKGK